MCELNHRIYNFQQIELNSPETFSTSSSATKHQKIKDAITIMKFLLYLILMRKSKNNNFKKNAYIQ